MTSFSSRREARPRRTLLFALLLAVCGWAAERPVAAQTTQATSTDGPPPRVNSQPIVHKVQAPNERLEMIINTSRILKLDKKMPQAQVGNPDILELTPLSATQVQLFAKKAGVTQVNLWDEDNNIHAVDVIVIGDARELQMILQTQFPSTSLKVTPLANSVIISGNVDNPNQISRITAIAADYYPNVINNITISGVQQVLLKVKVLEISRTKLRRLGVDWHLDIGDSFVESSVSSLLRVVGTGAGGGANAVWTGDVTRSASETFAFGILGASDSFFGFLAALQQNDIARLMAEPNLVAYSGRPASFNAGGEFPILVPQSLGTVSIEFKKYGTEIEFVPIVLGDGVIRLEVKPRVSELDDSRSVRTQGVDVPALRIREANTGVEMRAGETFALAGLVQTRTESQKRGLPLLADLPWAGTLFRKVEDETNEVELLILVTPELVEPMTPAQVPCGGPGMGTMLPNDVQLYFRGNLEVPYCPDDAACAPARAPVTADDPSVRSPIMDGMGGEVLPGPVHGEEVPADATLMPTPAEDHSAAVRRSTRRTAPTRSAGEPLHAPERASRPRRENRQIRTDGTARPAVQAASPPPGLIGPTGYDVQE